VATSPTKAKRKEIFASHPAPPGMRKPVGSLFTAVDLKILTRIARKRGVAETVFVHDLVKKHLR
jgi:hypothetical protein